MADGGNTAADFKRLLKNKKVLYGVGAVALLAVVMTLRKKSTAAGGGPGGSATPASPSGYYAPGTGDTTGTDLSGFLSNWGQAQISAQQQGFQSILDAIKGGGPAQNDDPPPAVPSVVYTKDPGGNVSWALLNSPYGGWMSTNSQQQANSWAQQYEPDQNANYVDWSAWQKLKEKWNK